MKKESLKTAAELLKLAGKYGIEELEYRDGDLTVRFSTQPGILGGSGLAGAAPSPPPQPAAAPSEVPPTPRADDEPDDLDSYATIASPMVGTFYRRPAPDKPPYVEVGDIVEPNQPVCIIEAMKLMNEIKSDIRGKIVKILVENAQPVTEGQVLFLIDPM